MNTGNVPALFGAGAPPRVLFLTEDPLRLHRQLAGEVLDLSTAGRLRDDVSTDEITPVAILSYYDQRLARFAYTGLHCGGEAPVAPGAMQASGIQVVVGGRRYGKGSSREHSPAAEKWAGVRLVFAESFERLYRQNADNIGLLTSTDFGLLRALLAGQPVTLEDLLYEREPLAAAILRAGGLLRFGQCHLREAARGAPGGAGEALPGSAAARPLTLFEKIVQRHWLATPATPEAPRPGQGGFVRADLRFIHEYYTGMAAHMLGQLDGLVLHQPERIVVFEDHSSYMDESPAHLRAGLVPNMQAMCQAQRDFVARHGLRCHRTLTDAEAALDDGQHPAGISHAMVAEHYALPGQVVVGTDSHTPHSGALGCLAFGVGTTDMANAFATGAVRLSLGAVAVADPVSAPVVRIVLDGQLAPGVTAKDVVLHLLALPEVRAGAWVGQVLEFAGPVVSALSTDERATLTNMSAELGGLTGMVAPDAETLRFLRERRGLEAVLEPWMCSDPGARYAAELQLDCTALTPMVAEPGDPGRGLSLQQLQQQGRRVPIDIAYAGSCTAGKREDFEHYHRVLAWGLAQGLQVPASVRLYLQYGTTAVRDYCVQRGYDQVFKAAGARILQPSCGACANCGPGASTSPEQVTVSSINRNFPGRSGPGQVWLASAPTVMASALAGELCSFEALQAGLRPQASA